MKKIMMAALTAVMFTTTAQAGGGIVTAQEAMCDLESMVNVTRYNPTELSDYQECWLDNYRDDDHGVLGSLFWVHVGDEYYSTQLKNLRTQAGIDTFLSTIDADIQVQIDAVAERGETISELMIAMDLLDEVNAEVDALNEIIEDLEMQLAMAQADVNTITAELTKEEGLSKQYKEWWLGRKAQVEALKIELAEEQGRASYWKGIAGERLDRIKELKGDLNDLQIAYDNKAYTFTVSGTTFTVNSNASILTVFNAAKEISLTQAIEFLPDGYAKNQAGIVGALVDMKLMLGKIANAPSNATKAGYVSADYTVSNNGDGAFSVDKNKDGSYHASEELFDIETLSSDLGSTVISAIEDAVEAAYEAGYDDGYAAGYADGFYDGVKSVK